MRKTANFLGSLCGYPVFVDDCPEEELENVRTQFQFLCTLLRHVDSGTVDITKKE